MVEPEVIALIAERKIQEAIEEGKFDNLPGKGEPLPLEHDQQVPLAARIANQVLKNAGVLPDWIQTSRDIEQERLEISHMRSKLVAENRKRLQRLSALPAGHPAREEHMRWHARQRTAWLKRIREVNHLVLKLCLISPSQMVSTVPYKIEQETARFDAEFVLPGSQAVEPESPAESKHGLLHLLAHERYEQGRDTLDGWISGIFHRKRSQ